MPLGDDKTTVTAVISTELKERLKAIAKVRRWTLSQAVSALIDDSIDKWVKDLGIEVESPPTPKRKGTKSAKSHTVS
jgi:predicted DNA-binding protein